MGEEEKKVEEHLLLKEEVINELDSAVKAFREEEITDLGMYARVKNAWEKANADPKLHKMIEKEIKIRRLRLHQLVEIDISKGDPIRARYDPAYWFTNVPAEFKVNEEKFRGFILDRIGSLREFFVNLRETSR
jgi:hypothetical protein